MTYEVLVTELLRFIHMTYYNYYYHYHYYLSFTITIISVTIVVIAFERT